MIKEKKIKLLLLILVIIFFCIFFAVWLLHSDEEEYNSSTIDEKIEQDITEEKIEENTSSVDDNKENTFDETVIDEETIDNSHSTHEEDKNNDNSVSENNPDNNIDNSPNNDSQENQEEIIEKKVCSDNDVEYQAWLNNFLSTNTSSRKFNSLEEAKAFGESSARNYGYGYFYNQVPIVYENDNCYKDNYFVQLYIPSKSCLDNPMMYLPNNETVINMYQYLDKIGYSCPEKIW